MLTRLAGWALIAFAAYFLLTNPDGAAAFVHSLLDGLQHAASSMSSFASHR
jgi:hypothetical protein